MSIVSDFDDIARRMNRKQETKPEATADESAAAVRTLKMLGYTYNDGCNLWKPPLGLPASTPANGLSKAQLGYQMMMADIASGYIKSMNG